jgi:hypothetical protein
MVQKHKGTPNGKQDPHIAYAQCASIPVKQVLQLYATTIGWRDGQTPHMATPFI